MSTIAPVVSTTASADRRRLGALAGLAAGPVFMTVVALLTWAQLDELHGLGWSFTGDTDVPWPSALVLGQYGALQVINFALAGVLIVVCALALGDSLRGVAGRVGWGLLTLAGIGLAFSAFPTDHAAARGDSPDTWHGVVHSAAFVVVAIPIVLAPLFVAWALRRSAPGLALASLGATALMVAGFALAGVIGYVAFTVFLLTVFGWIALLAYRLLLRPT